MLSTTIGALHAPNNIFLAELAARECVSIWERPFVQPGPCKVPNKGREIKSLTCRGRKLCPRKLPNIIGKPQNTIRMRPDITGKLPNTTTPAITRKQRITPIQQEGMRSMRVRTRMTRLRHTQRNMGRNSVSILLSRPTFRFRVAWCSAGPVRTFARGAGA
jgi:hypothetical protein